MSERREIRINVPALTRVEGEGALDLHISDGRIVDLKLAIYEPPRYFEKFLEGREPAEVPDIVARICGICPVAYQMSAAQALEQIAGFRPSDDLRRLRRIMYCGEWVQSHALHIHLLAAPDFLGCSSVTELAQSHAAEVRRGLMLQSLGNELIALFGGRSVHPVGVKIGGFHRPPSREECLALKARIDAALPEAAELVRWVAGLDIPDDPQDFVCVSLRHPGDYPITEGRLVSDDGLDIDIADFEQHFEEQHVPHSTALHARLHGRPYLTGPLARLNLNQDRLPPETRTLLEETGIPFPSRNVFHSMLARAVEIHLALMEAARLLAEPAGTNAPPIATLPAGTGYGCTEAPRGILWHRYDTDADGLVAAARIVPPTSQNQARIEEDLRRSLTRLGLDRDSDALRLHAETVIRNYDPCISCATHFLDLRLVRDSDPRTQASPSRPLVLIGAGSALGADSLGPRLAGMLQEDPALTPYLRDGRLQLIASLQPLRDGLTALTEEDRVVIADLLPQRPPAGGMPASLQPTAAPAPLAWHSHGLSIAQLAELQAILPLLPGTLEILPLPPATDDGDLHALGAALRHWLLQQLGQP